MAKRKPNGLASRTPLEPVSPFTTETVREAVASALRGPKNRFASPHPLPSPATIECWTSILNNWHRSFYAAQEDRKVTTLIEHAMAAIAELRSIMPIILERRRQDAERMMDGAGTPTNVDYFTRSSMRAMQEMNAFIKSDLPERVLTPPMPTESIRNWQWVAGASGDFVTALGVNAAGRFIADVVPLLTGEHPKPGAVTTWLKQQK